MIQKKNKKKIIGLTMVEMIVVMTILAIFSIFIVSFVVTSRQAWEVQNSSMAVRFEAKEGMETMVKELRETSLGSPIGITIPASPNNNTICFAIPNQISASKISSWKRVVYAYDSTNKQIIRKENGTDCSISCPSASSCKTLARNVESLQFSRSTDLVTVTVATSGTSQSGIGNSSTLNSQIVLRN
jgi:type II secretory pathway pseudopilin PulG